MLEPSLVAGVSLLGGGRTRVCVNRKFKPFQPFQGAGDCCCYFLLLFFFQFWLLYYSMFFKFLRFLDIPTDPTRRQGSTSETSALREWLRNLGVAESSLFLIAFGLMAFKGFVFRFRALVNHWLCFVLVPIGTYRA